MSARRTLTRLLLVAGLGALALVTAACADEADEADEADDPAEEAADEESVDAGAEGEPGDGDPQASTATFRGDELDFHQVECEAQFDGDGTDIRARAEDPQRADDDPWEDLVVEVNEGDPGSQVIVRRESPLDGQDWQLHEWRAPSAERETVEAGAGGASGEVDLELSPGEDDDPDETDHVIEFDLVC